MNDTGVPLTRAVDILIALGPKFCSKNDNNLKLSYHGLAAMRRLLAHAKLQYVMSDGVCVDFGTLGKCRFVPPESSLPWFAKNDSATDAQCNKQNTILQTIQTNGMPQYMARIERLLISCIINNGEIYDSVQEIELELESCNWFTYSIASELPFEKCSQ